MEFWPVNWVAVLIVVVFSQILGMLWYGPLFGKMWLGFIGRKQEDMKMTGGTIGGSIVTALVIGNMGITGVGGGILAAAVVWIGVRAMTSLNAALYSEVHKGGVDAERRVQPRPVRGRRHPLHRMAGAVGS